MRESAYMLSDKVRFKTQLFINCLESGVHQYYFHFFVNDEYPVEHRIYRRIIKPLGTLQSVLDILALRYIYRDAA